MIKLNLQLFASGSTGKGNGKKGRTSSSKRKYKGITDKNGYVIPGDFDF